MGGDCLAHLRVGIGAGGIDADARASLFGEALKGR